MMSEDNSLVCTTPAGGNGNGNGNVDHSDHGKDGKGKVKGEDGEGVQSESGGEVGSLSRKKRGPLHLASVKEREAFYYLQFALFTGWPASFYATGKENPSNLFLLH